MDSVILFPNSLDDPPGPLNTPVFFFRFENFFIGNINGTFCASGLHNRRYLGLVLGCARQARDMRL